MGNYPRTLCTFNPIWIGLRKILIWRLIHTVELVFLLGHKAVQIKKTHSWSFRKILVEAFLMSGFLTWLVVLFHIIKTDEEYCWESKYPNKVSYWHPSQILPQTKHKNWKCCLFYRRWSLNNINPLPTHQSRVPCSEWSKRLLMQIYI